MKQPHMKNAEFSPNGYRDLLEKILERGYKFKSFEDMVPHKKHIVLRHDIDIEISAALKIAEIEKSFNITGTYFVLLRSSLYNPASLENKDSLNEILQLGHKIGLHFDTTLYGEDLHAINKGANEECAILESILSEHVDLISFHRPAPQLLNQNSMIANRPHCYQPRFFSEIGYCSDSRGEWRFGRPLDHEAFKNGTALQLLTHPIWWVYEGDDPQDKLDLFVKRKVEDIQQELASNCQSFTPKSIVRYE